MVKLPSYFFHLWLPQAHVEAPTEGSIVLASIILKLGSFGLFRLRILSSSFLFVLRVVGVLVRPLVALVQRDLKSLVAYRRVAHMAILRFSLWCVSLRSFFARWVIQVRHGFVSALLFYLVGGIFHKRGSRLLYFRKDSNFYLFFVCCVFNSGGPISLSFLGEVSFFMTLLRESFTGMLIILVVILLTTLFNLYLFLSVLSKNNKTRGESILPLL